MSSNTILPYGLKKPTECHLYLRESEAQLGRPVDGKESTPVPCGKDSPVRASDTGAVRSASNLWMTKLAAVTVHPFPLLAPSYYTGGGNARLIRVQNNSGEVKAREEKVKR